MLTVVEKIMEACEDHDDMQNVYANNEIDDEELDKLMG